VHIFALFGYFCPTHRANCAAHLLASEVVANWNLGFTAL
jgi:hypothetical protein